MKDLRITKYTEIDEQSTKLLDIEGLSVVMCGQKKIKMSGDSGVSNKDVQCFTVIDSDKSKAKCDICKQDGEPYEFYKKEYIDLIKDDSGKIHYTILDHRFLKYLCRHHDRLHKFSKEYTFVEKKMNVTKRMENRVVYFAVRTSCNEAAQRVDYIVSRQAVGNIVRRWTERCDMLRGNFNTPTDLAVISAVNNERGYIFFADISHNRFLIVDVICGINAANIEAELRRFDLKKISTVITDSNSILVDALRSRLADGTELSIDVDSLLPPIIEKMKKYMNLFERQIDPNIKHAITLPREQVSQYYKDKMKETFRSRKELLEIYNHVNALRTIIKAGNHADYEKFEQWLETIPDEKYNLSRKKDTEKRETVFAEASVYVEDYMQEVLNFYRRRTNITGDVYQKIMVLVDKLGRWSDRAPELMRARLLYSGMIDTYENLANSQWAGISYDDVMKNIDLLISEGGNANG